MRDGRPAARASTSSRCPTRASRPTCSRWRWRWPRCPTGTALITENVFEAPLHVRQRAGAAGRRRAHRRPPRRRPRPGAAVQRAGAGHRHPGRGRAGAGRAVRRRRHRGARRAPRRPRLPGLRRAAARARRRRRAGRPRRTSRRSQPAGSGRDEGAGPVGVLGEDQHVGPAPGRAPSPTVRPDAGVGEHARAAPARTSRARTSVATPGEQARSRRWAVRRSRSRVENAHRPSSTITTRPRRREAPAGGDRAARCARSAGPSRVDIGTGVAVTPLRGG